jgi:hypothetical protein
MKMNASRRTSRVALLLLAVAACGEVGDHGGDSTGGSVGNAQESSSSPARSSSRAQGSLLDPLSADEIERVTEVLRAENRVSPSALGRRLETAPGHRAG